MGRARRHGAEQYDSLVGSSHLFAIALEYLEKLGEGAGVKGQGTRGDKGPGRAKGCGDVIAPSSEGVTYSPSAIVWNPVGKLTCPSIRMHLAYRVEITNDNHNILISSSLLLLMFP